MTDLKPLPIIPLPAAAEDVPELARIQVDAWATDLTNSLYSPTAGEFSNAISRAVSEHIPSPEWIVTKAVDSRTGKIVGFTSLQLHGYEKPGSLHSESSLKCNGKREQGDIKGDSAIEVAFNSKYSI